MLKSGSPDNVCVQDNSLFYVQYECNIRLEKMEQKWLIGSIFACLGIFMSLTFLILLFYLMSMSAIQFKEWDVGTVTASDFTVEYVIPKSVWRAFN